MAADEQPQQAPVAAVGVCFRKGAKVYYFLPGETPVGLGDLVVVETERGVDLGEVVSLPAELAPGENKPTRSVLRSATPGDLERKQRLVEQQQRALRLGREKVTQSGLPMKLIEAHYALDGRRLTFVFVSESRVDFRELVRDLAQTFRCRIELRQVGVRDQAKMLGGLGPCGRPLCCATFLRDFASVGIRLAKIQGLSLNPSKISGYCDRLMCCLRFEQEHYAQMSRTLPRVGEQVQAPGAQGEVVERNLLTGQVRVRTESGTELWLTEEELAGKPRPAPPGPCGCGAASVGPCPRCQGASPPPRPAEPGTRTGREPPTSGPAAPAAGQRQTNEPAPREQSRQHRRGGGRRGGSPGSPPLAGADAPARNQPPAASGREPGPPSGA